MSRITHWRLYLSRDVCKHAYVEISEQQAKQLQDGMAGIASNKVCSVVTGREIDVKNSRTLYVNPSQVVALEPRED